MILTVNTRPPHAPMLLVLMVLLSAVGCSHRDVVSRVEIREGLGLFDSLIPVSSDSVIELYKRYDSKTFHSEYDDDLGRAQSFIDSMNANLDGQLRIDTLAIDHAIENFGNAARSQKTIFLSSSYFFLFNEPLVIRSVLTHEFGHIFYETLSAEECDTLRNIWQGLRKRALFYIFREGEYSGNPKFGGHPDESPEELFASAFNLFQNRPDELRARLRYVGNEDQILIEQLHRLLSQSAIQRRTRGKSPESLPQ